MKSLSIFAILLFFAAGLLGCNSSGLSTDGSAADGSATAGRAVVPTQPRNLDRSCDLAPYPSVKWTTCETENFARILEAPTEELSAGFLSRWAAQNGGDLHSYLENELSDLSLLNPLSLNTPATPLCATGVLQCTGDPFRYPTADGPDGKQFYENEAEVTPVVFYDDGCARLSGHVWAPKGSAGERLPAVVIESGSIEAPEAAYWWAAQLLVRHGYVVMTFDPRGQGRSDEQTPTLGQGGNIDINVFVTGLVNAIDFFRSTPTQPYPWNETCAGTYPTKTTAYNPFYGRIDPARLGIAGHSAGAIGVSIVAGFGAPGAEPWPGLLDANNPVKAVVAWDTLISDDLGKPAPLVNLALPQQVAVPRVPAMGMSGDYISGNSLATLSVTGTLTVAPYLTPPDPQSHNMAFKDYVAAGIPAYSLTIAGATHFDFSEVPTFPATSWCPDTSSGACRGGWGIGVMEHYTLAWFDRWLKKPGEPGYADADQRLVDDAGSNGAVKFSWHYHSARDFPDRSGEWHVCEDIRGGCPN